MLLFGEKSDYDLGSLEKNFGISCDVDEYMELCKMCFHKNAPTWMITAFTRSITLHKFTSNLTIPENIQLSSNLNEDDEEKRK